MQVDPEFTATVDLIRRGQFGYEDFFSDVLDSITHGSDYYLLANDFQSYLKAQVRPMLIKHSVMQCVHQWQSSRDLLSGKAVEVSDEAVAASITNNASLQVQDKVDETYKDTAKWTKMSIMSTAGSGKFSSDRTIAEYAKDIWDVQACVVPAPQGEANVPARV